MTSCTGSTHGGFWGLWRKWVELNSASGKDGWLSLARQSQASGLMAGATRVGGGGGGGRWKSQNRKNVYLSPYVGGPLNSKVIKSFVPELRSRKYFSCFEIPMFYVYKLWTLYVRFAYPYHGYGTVSCCRFLGEQVLNKHTHVHTHTHKNIYRNIIPIPVYPLHAENVYWFNERKRF